MNLTEITPLINAKAEIYFASLLIIYLSFLIVNLIISKLIYSDKTKWDKVLLVWFFTALIVGIILIFLTASPEQVLNLITKMKGWFS